MMILYRGAPQAEKELRNRGFPGVFLTKSRETARGYGRNVSRWVLSVGPEQLLDFSSPGAEMLVREFAREHEEGYDERQRRRWQEAKNPFLANPSPLREDFLAVALYPDEDWVRFLSSRGYRGTINGNDVFVFDKGDLSPAATRAWISRNCKFAGR